MRHNDARKAKGNGPDAGRQNHAPDAQSLSGVTKALAIWEVFAPGSAPVRAAAEAERRAGAIVSAQPSDRTGPNQRAGWIACRGVPPSGPQHPNPHGKPHNDGNSKHGGMADGKRDVAPMQDVHGLTLG